MTGRKQRDNAFLLPGETVSNEVALHLAGFEPATWHMEHDTE